MKLFLYTSRNGYSQYHNNPFENAIVIYLLVYFELSVYYYTNDKRAYDKINVSYFIIKHEP